MDEPLQKKLSVGIQRQRGKVMTYDDDDVDVSLFFLTAQMSANDTRWRDDDDGEGRWRWLKPLLGGDVATYPILAVEKSLRGTL